MNYSVPFIRYSLHIDDRELHYTDRRSYIDLSYDIPLIKHDKYVLELIFSEV